MAVCEEALPGIEELLGARGACSADAGSKVVASEDACLEMQRGALMTEKSEVQGCLQCIPQVEETHGTLALTRGRRRGGGG